MVTTAIFAEILIVGLQGLAVIALCLASARGDLRTSLDLHAWVPLVVLVVSAVAYSLGVVIDRIADTAWKRLGKHIGLMRRHDTPAGVGVMRLAVMKESTGLAAFLEYQRSRLRIARATAVNLLVGLVAAAVYLGWRRPLPWGTSLAVGLALPVALAAAVFSAKRIDDAHMDRLCDAYAMLDTMKPKPVVAAVCHRVEAGVPLFLLVKTSGGDRWTFPKGHVERDDRGPSEAARREAEEEAGAVGHVAGHPFTCYLFPFGSGEHGHCVSAFLLRVTGTPSAGERGRDPTWCTADEAVRLLSLGRSARFAREHAGVVAAAVAELASRAGGGPSRP